MNLFMVEPIDEEELFEETEDESELNQKKIKNWKPAKFQSYETMGLTKTKLNPTVRPCGFQKNG